MSQHVRMTLISDLAAASDPDTQVEADGTVRFGFDGNEYEIDLTDEEKAEFGLLIAPYAAAARRLTPRRRRGRSPRTAPADAVDPQAVRSWARENGIDVKDRGQLPASVLDKYRAATGR
jgi:hypothetical protein